jgi:hypothetical protein
MSRDADDSQSTYRPTTADNHAEREAQIDGIVARLRRLETDGLMSATRSSAGASNCRVALAAA